MTVQIIDENDNAPRFSPTLYLETVVESSTPGTEVVVVTATDSDLDAVIRYQLVDTFGKFHIDSVVSVRTLLAAYCLCGLELTQPAMNQTSNFHKEKHKSEGLYFCIQ